MLNEIEKIQHDSEMDLKWFELHLKMGKSMDENVDKMKIEKFGHLRDFWFKFSVENELYNLATFLKNKNE